MANYEYPGVYVEEISTLPPSVAGVSTAIPAFIGYTETGYDATKGPSPVRISNLMDYRTHFEGGKNADISYDTATNEVTITGFKYTMYHNLSMYFKNGGGPCYIVSVGTYDNEHAKADFTSGLTALEKQDEPTLIIISEAVNLAPADYYALCQDVLNQCNKLGDRFAIFDVLNGDDTQVAEFRNNVSSGLSEIWSSLLSIPADCTELYV